MFLVNSVIEIILCIIFHYIMFIHLIQIIIIIPSTLIITYYLQAHGLHPNIAENWK